MTEAVVVCEGQTEETFLRDVLAPALSVREIFVLPRIVPTSSKAKGGGLERQRVLWFLRNTLRERQDTYVTTFFDLYGLKPDFPGQADAAGIPDPLARASIIEMELAKAVVQEAKCRPERFLPHVQPYEFESLLFSDTGRFGEERPAWKTFIDQLETARRKARSPEHINDGPDIHPSARLRRLLRPRYDKALHGSAVSKRIGLDRMRAECRHFDKWLSRAEALPPLR